MLGISQKLYSQNSVGIGTATPNTNAILDLVSTDQGFLIPRIDTNTLLTVLRPTLAASDDGMLVYADEINAFVYWDGDSLDWYLLNENLGGGSGSDDDWSILGDTIYSGRDYVSIGGNVNANSKVSIESNKEMALIINNSGTTQSIGALIQAGSAANQNTAIDARAFGGTGDTTVGINSSAFNVGNVGVGVRGTVEGYGNGALLYAGIFEAKGNAGDTAYGLISSAKGGDLNFAGYFTDGYVVVEDTLIVGGNPLGAGAILQDIDGSGKLGWVNPSSGNSWTLLGNAGTVDNTNFIGTIDDIPLNFRVNNFRAGRVESDSWTGDNYANSFYGYEAGTAITVGFENSGFGYWSLYDNTIGEENAAYGAYSLRSNTSGDYNAGVGNRALNSNTIGNRNTAVGYQSSTGNREASDNSSLGYRALRNNGYSEKNVAIGAEALTAHFFNNSFTVYNGENVAVGYRSLFSNNPTTSTNGVQNTALGALSGSMNVVGNQNTFIGYNADAVASNLVNATAIGANALVGTSNSVILGNNANVGVGTSTPSAKMEIQQNSGVSPQLLLHQTSTGFGQLRMTNTVANKYFAHTFSPNATDAFSGYNIYYHNGASGSNILSVYGDGKVAINPSAASTHNFDVFGTSMFRDTINLPYGAVAAGNVLTSDASGNATWQPAGGADLDWSISPGVVSNTLDNIGIGTSNPLGKLHVRTADNAVGGTMIQTASSTGNEEPYLYLVKSRGSSAVPAAVGDGDRIGGVSFNGYDGTDFQDGALIYSNTDGAWNAGNRGAKLHFATTKNGTTSMTDMMTIGNDGVGIGWNDPVWPLQVETTDEIRAGYFKNVFTTGSNTMALYGITSGNGAGEHYGGYFETQNGTGKSIGVAGYGVDGDTVIGVYGNALNGSVNYAGYFDNGDVFVQNSLILPTGAAAGRVLTSDANGRASWQIASGGSDIAATLAIGKDAGADSIFNLGGISINSGNVDPSAVMDLNSTSAGVLIPRMDETARDAITSPANGLLVFQEDAGSEGIGFYYYDNPTAKWVKLGDQNNICNTGFVAGNAKYCIENTEHAGADFWNATETCANADARLCTFTEWYHACTNTLVGTATGNFEWIEYGGLNSGHVVGNTNCESMSTDAKSNAHTYRCCYSK